MAVEQGPHRRGWGWQASPLHVLYDPGKSSCMGVGGCASSSGRRDATHERDMKINFCNRQEPWLDGDVRSKK